MHIQLTQEYVYLCLIHTQSSAFKQSVDQLQRLLSYLDVSTLRRHTYFLSCSFNNKSRVSDHWEVTLVHQHFGLVTPLLWYIYY